METEEFPGVDGDVSVVETEAGARAILLIANGMVVVVTPTQARRLAAALVELADSVPSA